MLELKQQDAPQDLAGIKVEGEQVGGWALQDGGFEVPETMSTGTGATAVKNDDQVVELSKSSSPFASPGRPRKTQRRVVMDVILVPTLAEIQRNKGADDDDIKKLKKLFKPKKKEQLTISDETLMSRLKPIGLDGFAVNLPRAELNQMVSRAFMASTYGGSMQAVFPDIKAARIAEHGMAYFMYLHPKYHPYAPQVPGGGGLWFDPDPEWCEDPLDQVQRVLTRDRKNAVWQYMGQYEIKRTTSLTRAEWLGLGKMRDIWAWKIATKDWGKRVCARIQARKEVGPDREPTQREVAAVRNSERWKYARPEDVRTAFDRGQQRMGVWTIKCVGYDYRFQLELYDKYPTWTPPARSNPKLKGPKRLKKIKEEAKVEVKAEDGVPPPAKAPKGKKRKRTVTMDSETSIESETKKDEAEAMEIVDDEERAFIKIRTRGTKSRPIVL